MLAIVLATPAAASSYMTKAEANIAVATLDPGRMYDLVRPFADDASLSMRLFPSDFDRLGRRSGIVSVAADVNNRPVLFNVLVRERPRSGRIIVRAIVTS